MGPVPALILPSLRRNFSWTLFGNLVYAGCQWLVIVVIAKLGSPTLVGQFTLAIAITSPVMLLAGMGLRIVQANDVAATRPFGLYLGLRMTSTAIAVAVIAAIALAGTYDHSTIAIILILALAKSAEALSEIVWGQLQQRELMSVIARSMALKGALSVTSVLVVLAITHDLVLATVGFACAWLATLALYDLRAARRLFHESLRPRFAAQPMIELARLAFPLGIVVMLASYAVNTPRYFIAHYQGDHELGVFSAIANLTLIGSTIMTALGQVTTPRLARCALENNRRGFVRLLRLLLLVGVVLGGSALLIALVAGGPLLSLLYTRDYASGANIFVLAMLAGLAANIANAFGVAVIALGKYRVPVALQALNLGAVLIACAVLVPARGAVGAAWALVVSNVTNALSFGGLFVYCVRRIDR
jgi:O-antigen/teichoic acid export membrane protein